MKPAQLIKGLFGAALFIFFPRIVSAQEHPTETCPESAMPMVTFRPVIHSGPDTFFNYYQFMVDWEGDAATCHHNPPLPIHEGQLDTAQWIYFWNFGDDTYSGDTMPLHAFKASGTYTVEVALKPIYSDDQDPFGKPKASVTMEVPGGNHERKKDTTYLMLPDTGALKLAANWYASRPRGKLTFAITYRVRSDNPVSGKVLFLHSVDRLEIIDVQRAPSTTGSRVDIPAGLRTPEALKGFSWEFSNLRNSDGEKTIFIDVQVPADVIGQEDESTVQANVFAAIGYNGVTDNLSDPDDTTDPDDTNNQDSTNVDIVVTKTAAPPPQKKDSFFDIIFGLSEGGEDSELESSFEETYDFYREESAPVAVNWASDPNFILCSPLMLPPGATNETIDYSVHFQNDGSASVRGNDLRVTIGVDPLLDPQGLTPGDRHPQCLDTAITFPPPQIVWSTKTVLGEDPTCKLQSLGDAQTLSFSEDATWGRVAYQILTKPGHVFAEGDTIYAQATVRMEGSEVKTDVAKIPVGIPEFCSQGFFGLKFAYHLANGEHRSGWGLGLTARYPLGKVKNPGFEAHINKSIKKNNYPLFWWQGELGYGQTRLRPGMNDSFLLRHIDVSPFVLRFIAKKPALQLGNTAIQRGWGISAGYTGSYLLSSELNGADDPGLGGLSFGDRLDHSISLSADFLNLIGQPGLSLGAGYRWRNTQIGGQRHWYSNAFIYLHYTFSYRLRKEFGWLN